MTYCMKEILFYKTCQDFKNELHRRTGIMIMEDLWSQIQPETPLPWQEVDLKESLSRLSGQIQRLTTCPRCGGDLVVDKDLDGYYKRCVQCGFNIPFEVPVLKRKLPEKKMYPWRVASQATITHKSKVTISIPAGMAAHR
jgi:hypothetical protein